MSRPRAGTCQDPGPHGAHCTLDRAHDFSCYDAGADESWNYHSPDPQEWPHQPCEHCDEERV